MEWSEIFNDDNTDRAENEEVRDRVVSSTNC